MFFVIASKKNWYIELDVSGKNIVSIHNKNIQGLTATVSLLKKKQF